MHNNTSYEVRVYDGFTGAHENTDSRTGIAAATDYIMEQMARGKECNVYHGPHLTSCTRPRYIHVGREAFALELVDALLRS